MGEHRIARFAFMRALGAIHVFAFASFLVQARGLFGAHGVLPLASFLDVIESRVGVERYFELPMVFWWTGGSELALICVAWAGIVLGMALMFGFLEHAALLLLWFLYLSISLAGRTFFSFQWDILLLEVTVYALFLAAPQLLPEYLTKRTAILPDRSSVRLHQLLLFKLVFSSGVAKWGSGDLAWRELTALQYHYETQPLPTWIGWYAHQLPASFQRFSVGAMFFIQLLVPFFFFVGGRRVRLMAAGLQAMLQILILLTGNYCFFNLIALALCLLLVDDGFLARAVPPRLRPFFGAGDSPASGLAPRGPGRFVRPVLMIPILVLDGLILVRTVSGGEAVSEAGERILMAAAPYRTVNGYGLFAVMTTSRKEIVVEGSDDGLRWKAYEFKYKSGAVDRRPEFVEPHQPRLDWQMWFAALGGPRQSPWFNAFAVRLLQGAPEVLGLLAANPFPEHPPRYVRGELYDYRFTDFEERARTGAWWRRTAEGDWFPARALDGSTPDVMH